MRSLGVPRKNAYGPTHTTETPWDPPLPPLPPGAPQDPTNPWELPSGGRGGNQPPGGRWGPTYTTPEGETLSVQQPGSMFDTSPGAHLGPNYGATHTQEAGSIFDTTPGHHWGPTSNNEGAVTPVTPGEKGEPGTAGGILPGGGGAGGGGGSGGAGGSVGNINLPHFNFNFGQEDLRKWISTITNTLNSISSARSSVQNIIHGNPSPWDDPEKAKSFLDEVYPGTSPWERVGSAGGMAGAGASSAAAESQRGNVERSLANAKQLQQRQISQTRWEILMKEVGQLLQKRVQGKPETFEKSWKLLQQVFNENLPGIQPSGASPAERMASVAEAQLPINQQNADTNKQQARVAALNALTKIRETDIKGGQLKVSQKGVWAQTHSAHASMKQAQAAITNAETNKLNAATRRGSLDLANRQLRQIERRFDEEVRTWSIDRKVKLAKTIADYKLLKINAILREQGQGHFTKELHGITHIVHKAIALFVNQSGGHMDASDIRQEVDDLMPSILNKALAKETLNK